MAELTRNGSITLVAATGKDVLLENQQRKAFFITNTGGAAVTLNKGTNAPAVGSGIVLQPNQVYFEGDTEGFGCWKGRISAISAAAGSLGVSETISDSQVF